MIQNSFPEINDQKINDNYPLIGSVYKGPAVSDRKRRILNHMFIVSIETDCESVNVKKAADGSFFVASFPLFILSQC